MKAHTLQSGSIMPLRFALGRRRALAQVVEHVGELGGGQGQAGVGAAVVDADRAARLVQNPAAGKHDAVDVALALVGHLGREDPFVAAPQDAAGIFQIEQAPVPGDTDTRRRCSARRGRGSASPRAFPAAAGSSRSCWHPTRRRAARAAERGGRPNASGRARRKARCGRRNCPPKPADESSRSDCRSGGERRRRPCPPAA